MTEDYAAAEQTTKTFTLLYPGDSLAHHYHALALQNLDRLEEARDELLAARRLHPTEGGLNNLISIGLLFGRKQEVVGYLKNVRPPAANYYGRLAQVLDRDLVGAEAAISVSDSQQ